MVLWQEGRGGYFHVRGGGGGWRFAWGCARVGWAVFRVRLGGVARFSGPGGGLGWRFWPERRPGGWRGWKRVGGVCRANGSMVSAPVEPVLGYSAACGCNIWYNG